MDGGPWAQVTQVTGPKRQSPCGEHKGVRVGCLRLAGARAVWRLEKGCMRDLIYSISKHAAVLCWFFGKIVKKIICIQYWIYFKHLLEVRRGGWLRYQSEQPDWPRHNEKWKHQVSRGEPPRHPAQHGQCGRTPDVFFPKKQAHTPPWTPWDLGMKLWDRLSSWEKQTSGSKNYLWI